MHLRKLELRLRSHPLGKGGVSNYVSKGLPDSSIQVSMIVLAMIEFIAGIWRRVIVPVIMRTTLEAPTVQAHSPQRLSAWCGHG